MGTRFLPGHESRPKEMLRWWTSLIQYAVEEAVAAESHRGLHYRAQQTRHRGSLSHKAYELETELMARNKLKFVEQATRSFPQHVSCSMCGKTEALDLPCHPLCATGWSVMNPRGDPGRRSDRWRSSGHEAAGGRLRERALLRAFCSDRCARRNVELRLVMTEPGERGMHRITGIVEKPKPEVAPSTLAVVGRYLLEPEIFDHLEKVKPGTGGEIQLTDGIASMLNKQRALAYEFQGVRYDCGSKLGYRSECALCDAPPEIVMISRLRIPKTQKKTGTARC